MPGKKLAMVGIRRKGESGFKITIPPGEYNAEEFARLFPHRYRNLREAGFKGVGVGENVTFTVK